MNASNAISWSAPRDCGVECPGCQARLVAENTSHALLCPRCGKRFTDAPRADRGRLSKRAVASMLLGFSSVIGMLLTGIPAIVLGLLALRDVRRGEGNLRGQGQAVTGIVSGTLLGMLCSPFVLNIIITTTQMASARTETWKSPEVAKVAREELGVTVFPADLHPIYAQSDTGGRRLVFAEKWKEPKIVVILVQQPANPMASMTVVTAMSSELDRRGLKFPVEETSKWEHVIDGRPVTITEARGTGLGGEEPRRSFTLTRSHGQTLQGITIVTGEANSEPGDPNLTLDEVKQFLDGLSSVQKQ